MIEGINVIPCDVRNMGIITGAEADQLQQVGTDLRIGCHVRIRPQQYVNISVLEKFNMQGHFGLIIIRSSYSRKGLFSSSGVYDPGFTGKGGISLYNMSNKTIVLEQGTRIAQMIVLKASYNALYNGHYNKSKIIDSKLED